MTGTSPIRTANKRAILRQLQDGQWHALELTDLEMLAARELEGRGRIEKRWNSERWNSERRGFEWRRPDKAAG